MLSVALHAPSAFPCHEFLIQTPVALPLQLQEHAGQEGLKQPSARQTGWGGQTPHPSPPVFPSCTGKESLEVKRFVQINKELDTTLSS